MIRMLQGAIFVLGQRAELHRVMALNTPPIFSVQSFPKLKNYFQTVLLNKADPECVK